jgi:hypothetical protein
MATADVGFVAVSRAVVAAAAGLAAEVERRVLGDEHVRTAQGNAWEAICADRARAQARAEMDALVATLATWPADARTTQHQTTERQTAQDRATQGRSTRGQAGQSRRKQARRGGQRAVGSSPRSSASQAALVSTR